MEEKDLLTQKASAENEKFNTTSFYSQKVIVVYFFILIDELSHCYQLYIFMSGGDDEKVKG